MRGHKDNPTVNRYLKDKAMDRIDHALGRPVDPLRETYRDHYAVEKDSDIAAEFRASSNWQEEQPSALNEDMRWFYVTDVGRQALANHLKKINDGNRRFVVTWEGYDTIVAAETHSKARYSKYLAVSDVMVADGAAEVTFVKFIYLSKDEEKQQTPRQDEEAE